VKQAEDDDHFNVDEVLQKLIKKPDYSSRPGTPFFVFAEIHTGEIEQIPGQGKAPNFRGTVRYKGTIADAFGWMPKEVSDKIVAANNTPDKTTYILGHAVRQDSRMNNGFYELKMSSNSIVGDGAYFKKIFPGLHKDFMHQQSLHSNPDNDKDDSYPKLTVYAALTKIHTEPEQKTFFVKSSITIVEAGSNLTVPICSRPNCTLQCGYTSDTGPFTCNEHGEVEPEIISRPHAMVELKIENNRHGSEDEDTTIECTIAKNQEATYLGLSLDNLQNDDIDVDSIREILVGQRFMCTLVISKTNTTVIRLQKDYNK
jgi:hypothetical protein